MAQVVLRVRCGWHVAVHTVYILHFMSGNGISVVVIYWVKKSSAPKLLFQTPFEHFLATSGPN